MVITAGRNRNTYHGQLRLHNRRHDNLGRCHTGSVRLLLCLRFVYVHSPPSSAKESKSIAMKHTGIMVPKSVSLELIRAYPQASVLKATEDLFFSNFVRIFTGYFG